VGISNLLASSRAIRAGERENSENLVKIESFPKALRSCPIFERPANGGGQKRRAHSCESAGPRSIVRKGEPKSRIKRLAANWKKEARSCHTLLHRQSAHCRKAPRSSVSTFTLPADAPDHNQGYKGGCC
jgi:hypothetical protein